jgi:CheY-like chemotaxis protein
MSLIPVAASEKHPGNGQSDHTWLLPGATDYKSHRSREVTNVTLSQLPKKHYPVRRMALNSLLVCADAQAVQVLTKILQDLGIGVESCGTPLAATARINEQKFDAILVDCQDEPAAKKLIAHIRETSINNKAIAVAMVDGGNKIREIFDKGANFILYKPVSAERAGNSMRAARGLMQRDRRSQRRASAQTQASISYSDVADAAAKLVDLAESGLAMESERRLPPSCKVYFQFALPQNRSQVRLSGEVVWQDSSGRVGIRFVNVPQSSQKILKGWLEANLAQQNVPASVDPEHSEHPEEDPAVTLSAGLGLLTVCSADRRSRSRKGCSLSAEVYQADHKVPNRCRLSDVSNGGCYVETPLPFATGTALEIMVRTDELKLRIYGKVKSTHPGFGMGVQFNLDTPEQHSQVQQLIACATALLEEAEPEPEVTP